MSKIQLFKDITNKQLKLNGNNISRKQSINTNPKESNDIQKTVKKYNPQKPPSIFTR